MGTKARAWGMGLCLGMASTSACFNPPKDAGLTSSSLMCTAGALDCECTEQGTCNAGLQCVADVCVGDDPTGTGDTTGPVTTTTEPATADDTVDPTTTGGTTVALDDTSTGDVTTGDVTTGDSTTGDSTTGTSEPVMEMVFFPTPGDPRVILSGTLPWNGGDYYEGIRDTIVPSVSQLDVHVPIVKNGLTECGFQEAEVILNGVSLGTFVIAQGTAVIDASFPSPGIVGPQYTIRYQTVATVESGCGAAGYDESSSTVTLWE